MEIQIFVITCNDFTSIIKFFLSGGMDEFSWTLNSDGVVCHNKQELYKIGMSNGTLANNATDTVQNPQEGDVLGISYDHIQLKFYINGAEVDYPVSIVKGTVYPALYGMITYINYCSFG